MKKFIKHLQYLPGLLKMFLIKLFHYKQFKFSVKSHYPISLKIKFKTKQGTITIGKGFNARENVTIRVNGNLVIGTNVFINSNSRIECEKEVIIGNDVLIGPNVSIYDHDHNIVKGKKYNSSNLVSGSVLIGNNIWIGLGAIILRKTVIGDNSVIGAGSILRGNIPEDTLFYQKRDNHYKEIL
jgi:acetyltransferase-like isoleucine patch superfamily enzyme